MLDEYFLWSLLPLMWAGCRELNGFIVLCLCSYLNAVASAAHWPPSVQQSGTESAKSIKPRSLWEESCKETSSPPTQCVDSLRIQQLSLSSSPGLSSVSDPAGSTVCAGGNVQLQPPSFFSHQSRQVSTQLQLGAASGAQDTVFQQQQQQQQTAAQQATGHSAGQGTEQATPHQPLVASKMSNPKLALNTYCQKRGISPPHYTCSYPEDAVGYIATVSVDSRKFTSTAEGTKRAAEAMAAGMALKSFGLEVEVQRGGEQGSTNGHSFQGELKESQSSISGELMLQVCNYNALDGQRFYL